MCIIISINRIIIIMSSIIIVSIISIIVSSSIINACARGDSHRGAPHVHPVPSGPHPRTARQKKKNVYIYNCIIVYNCVYL